MDGLETKLFVLFELIVSRGAQATDISAILGFSKVPTAHLLTRSHQALHRPSDAHGCEGKLWRRQT